jgi:hypothetical protein
MENLVQRTLIEYDTFDPVKNLWRNVLVTAIEDAIKLKNRTIEFKIKKLEEEIDMLRKQKIYLQSKLKEKGNQDESKNINK